jgi:hypothetical protein
MIDDVRDYLSMMVSEAFAESGVMLLAVRFAISRARIVYINRIVIDDM